MKFDINGNLKPYEIIYTDWATFKAEFVDAFPRSSTRQVIFQNFSIYMEKLVAIIGTDFHQWIDGSFVTRKLNPNDIDFVTFINAKTFSRNEHILGSLREYSREQSLRLDGYVVKDYPTDHKHFFRSHLDSKQWLHEFVRDSRKGQPKGFIQLDYWVMKPQSMLELEEWELRVSRLIGLVATTNQTLHMHRESGDSWLMVKQYEELLAEHQQELDQLLKTHGLTLKVVPADSAA